MPRRMNRSDRTSITSIALSLRATRIAKHSWLNSSSTLSIRYLRPSWVRSSTKSPRSGGLRPPYSGPARPEHRPAAASQGSLQACIASLPSQSSWMSKTYLKSDHFNGVDHCSPPPLKRSDLSAFGEERTFRGTEHHLDRRD